MQTSMDVKLISSEVDRYREREPVEEVCWRSRALHQSTPSIHRHEVAL